MTPKERSTLLPLFRGEVDLRNLHRQVTEISVSVSESTASATSIAGASVEAHNADPRAHAEELLIVPRSVVVLDLATKVPVWSRTNGTPVIRLTDLVAAGLA